jgi:prepilin-type N-terminal cleavage/methylation domain-containing protein
MDKHISARRLIVARGFSLVEMMACTAILLIAAVAATPAIVGAGRSWQNTYDSVPASLVRAGREARLVFQTAARRARLESLTIDPDGHWIELPYYDSPDSDRADRYARLSWVDGQLSVREGRIGEYGAREMRSERTVCENVSDCVFTRSAKSIQMKLTFTAGATQMTMVAAAMMNNE